MKCILQRILVFTCFLGSREFFHPAEKKENVDSIEFSFSLLTEWKTDISSAENWYRRFAMIKIMLGWLDLNSGFSFRHAGNPEDMVLLYTLESQATNHEIGKEFQNNFLRSEMWTINSPILFSHFFIGRNFLFEYLNEIFISRLLKVLYTAFIFRGIFFFLIKLNKLPSFCLFPSKGSFPTSTNKCHRI